MAQEAQRKPSADGLIIIPTTNSNFIRAWLELMRPFHHLAPREMDFTAVLLAKRCQIAKEVTNNALVDKLLFEDEMKEQIREEAGVTKAHMQMILRRLRECEVLEGKRISPTYALSWTEGQPFRMVFVFKNSNDSGRNNTTGGSGNESSI